MKTYRTLLLAMFICWIPSSALAQADLSSLDEYFESSRSDWDVPGMAVAIVKDGEIVHIGGYGVLEVGSSTKVDDHTLFAIASNTKAFISSSIASLVDAGKMSWDDPIGKHLPYFQLVDEVATQRATVRDALSHGVGLGTYSGDVIWYKSNHTAEEVLKLVSHLEPAFEFRTGYGYSNVMFVAAGEVIGAVAGKPWDEYVQDHFFDPLGMSRSQTSTARLKELGNVATPHKISAGANLAIGFADWYSMGSGASASVISSAHDMAQWVRMHLNEGELNGTRYYSEAAQQQMWHPQFNYSVTPSTRETYPGRNFNGYGLAFGVSEYRGQFMAAHGGAYDGMYSRVAMVPDMELGIVVLTNTMKNMGPWLVYDIVDAYLGDSVRDWSGYGLERDNRSKTAFANRMDSFRDARVEGTSPTLERDNIEGTYHDDLYGGIVVVTEEGTLRLTFPRSPDLNATLEHFHYDTYEIKWDQTHSWFDFGTVQFESNHKREVVGMSFSVPNEDIFFEELNLKKVN
ncbi:MAG TPA: serine hydrolase [Bacteroidetes bacterium]|nr:serine hydrolase [Bacteroidota bacterium]